MTKLTPDDIANLRLLGYLVKMMKGKLRSKVITLLSKKTSDAGSFTKLKKTIMNIVTNSLRCSRLSIMLRT